MKKLNFIHEWIGPHGPLSNSRIPNIADFVHQNFKNYYPNRSIEYIPDQGMPPCYMWLHQDYFDYINVYTPNTMPPANFIYEMEMHHIRDWYSNFYPMKGIFENAHVSPIILDKVKDKKGYLMFSTVMESFLDDRMFNLMHDYFKTHRIPPEQIIYLTDSPNAHVVYDRYCQKENIKEKINVEYLPSWMLEFKDRLDKTPTLLNNEYVSGKREKTFLNFNRRYRPQRFVFLMEMNKRKLLNDFYISFDKTQPEGYKDFLDMALDINKTQAIGLSNDELNELDNMLPLTLDTDDFSSFPMEKKMADTLYLYNNSLINVISETEFYTDILQLTEKTFKPIVYKQPFIMVGPPFSLNVLKEYGFKTFSKFWDESYDTIKGHEERMEAIVKLIHKISTLSESEKIKLSHDVKETVDFNFKHMRNRKPVEVFNFIEKYGS